MWATLWNSCATSFGRTLSRWTAGLFPPLRSVFGLCGGRLRWPVVLEPTLECE
jgi:hypothetical protein